MDKFIIFGHRACGFCRQAKAVLQANAVEFNYIDIHEESISQADLSKKIGQPAKTVPQIFYNDLYVGGYQELIKYLKKEKLLA
jgi:glutaredoxin 1